MSNDRSDTLKQLISAGKTAEAIALVKTAEGYREAEGFAATALRSDADLPVIEASLEAFLNSRENRYEKHGRWVHSLSHFTAELWEKKLYSWVKKFNEVALEGAQELRDSNCCERLIGDFINFASWSVNPADFGLTPESVRWVKRCNAFDTARIAAGAFVSEADYLKWKLAHGTYSKWSNEGQAEMVDAKAFNADVERLKKLGVKVDSYERQLAEMLKSQLAMLRDKLGKAENGWMVEKYKKAIEMTEAQLA